MTDQAAIRTFADFVAAQIDAHHVKRGNVRLPDDTTVRVDVGPKFARLSVRGSAYCFVELTTGNILKCAGWKAPAKGVRGNIAMTPDELRVRLGPYGVNYTGVSFLTA